jgi:hypothetical protein
MGSLHIWSFFNNCLQHLTSRHHPKPGALTLKRLLIINEFPQPRIVDKDSLKIFIIPRKKKQVLIKKGGHRFIPHVKSQELEEVGNQTMNLKLKKI